jgi:hypothetical protein
MIPAAEAPIAGDILGALEPGNGSSEAIFLRVAL